MTSTYGRWLGIDPGTKRIGFAVSDDLRWTVRPLEVWICKSEAEDVAHVVSLVEEHEVIEVIVGVPYRLDGSESESTLRAKAFIARLTPALPEGVAISERDEALTTWEAQQKMVDLGITPERGLVDAYAAAVILQEALEDRSEK